MHRCCNGHRGAPNWTSVWVQGLERTHGEFGDTWPHVPAPMQMSYWDIVAVSVQPLSPNRHEWDCPHRNTQHLCVPVQVSMALHGSKLPLVNEGHI